MKTNKIMLGILGILMVSLMVSGVFAVQGSGKYGKDISSKKIMKIDDLEKPHTKPGKVPIGNDLISRPNTMPLQGVSVSLPVNVKIPETKVGEKISFSVTVKDLHPKVRCLAVDDVKCPSSEYEYKLSLRTENGVKGEFSAEKIVLKAGEEKEIRLTLVTKKPGYHPFVIKVTGDANARTKGAFFARGMTETNGHFFRGSGYAVNLEETDGILVDLGILNSDGNLKGKISLYGESFALKGKVRDGDVKFDFVNKQGTHYGSFSGSVKKFRTFLLLKGELTFKDKVYKLSAVSKKKNIVREITPKEKKTRARVNDLIIINKKKVIRGIEDSVAEQMGDEETFIKPLKVRNKYFLWIFPTGKVLDLEIFHGDKIIKKSINEKDSLKVDDLNIKVGSLEDSENIEISVE